MSERHPDLDASKQAERVSYPTNHVVAVVDHPEQVASTVSDLTSAGFLESEVEVSCGKDAADRLASSTGRTGLAHLAIRVAERLHLTDEEMEAKKEYERALRDGSYVLSVMAQTDERKKRAADLLGGHGATSVKFLGRFTIETLAD